MAMNPSVEPVDGAEPAYDARVAGAMDRVLEAERAARSAIADCEREVQAPLEQARQQRRTILERAHDRIMALHARAARSLDERIADMLSKTHRAPGLATAQRTDDARLHAALEGLVERLTRRGRGRAVKAMPIEGNLDYALTRVHARHGQRLDEAGWRRLESNRDLGLYLAAVRSTTLADWVSGFDPEHDCHTFERALRVQWRRYVDRGGGLASAGLASVARLARVAAGIESAGAARAPEPAPAWMLADPVYGPLAPGTPADRAAALAPHRARTAAKRTWPARFRSARPGSAHWHTLAAAPRRAHAALARAAAASDAAARRESGACRR